MGYVEKERYVRTQLFAYEVSEAELCPLLLYIAVEQQGNKKVYSMLLAYRTWQQGKEASRTARFFETFPLLAESSWLSKTRTCMNTTWGGNSLYDKSI
jgi:hypothetical protein